MALEALFEGTFESRIGPDRKFQLPGSYIEVIKQRNADASYFNKKKFNPNRFKLYLREVDVLNGTADSGIHVYDALQLDHIMYQLKDTFKSGSMQIDGVHIYGSNDYLRWFQQEKIKDGSITIPPWLMRNTSLMNAPAVIEPSDDGQAFLVYKKV